MKNVSQKTANLSELFNVEGLILDNKLNSKEIKEIKRRLTAAEKNKMRLSQQGKDLTFEQFVIDQLSLLIKEYTHLIHARNILIEAI